MIKRLTCLPKTKAVVFGYRSFKLSNVSKGITHPVFYGDLVYKLRRVKSESNFISSGSKIVKRLRRRQYDAEIIERTIGLVLSPFTALYRSFRTRYQSKVINNLQEPVVRDTFLNTDQYHSTVHQEEMSLH